MFYYNYKLGLIDSWHKKNKKVFNLKKKNELLHHFIKVVITSLIICFLYCLYIHILPSPSSISICSLSDLLDIPETLLSLLAIEASLTEPRLLEPAPGLIGLPLPSSRTDSICLRLAALGDRYDLLGDWLEDLCEGFGDLC